MQQNKLREELGSETLWGLPKSISDEFIAAYELTVFRQIGTWLYLTILLGGLGVGIGIWFLCEGILAKSAEESAVLLNGLAYHTDFGIGLFIGLFAWMAITCIICDIYLRLTPAPYKTAIFLGAYSGPKTKTIPPKTLLKKDKTHWRDAADLIDNGTRRYTKIATIIAVPLTLLSIGVTYAELKHFTVISPKGVHKSAFLTGQMKLKEWDEAVKVEIGCNYVKARYGKNSSPEKHDVVYHIHWADKSKTRLQTDNQLNGKHWLVNFEAIDDILIDSDATFTRWEWLKRNPLHPKCLRHHRNKLGPELAPRFDSLLRVDEEG